ncbi:iron uptake system component EfeO [Frondihabitans sp. PhB188]|uniref:iron uptake system protein EfeO n=1 Tax=Frondihabitans sp. PhB188 TaxID=2485200 RepID=UPI000F4AACE4|nr:iron uptake system protein EfeO [Frondihabitans sp. PhB188]ROQ38454.1 iron uptake system component EfeO [Frondihabitans sp. PhB188]
MTLRPLGIAAGVAIAALALTGCVENNPGGGSSSAAGTIAVTGKDTTCELSSTTAPSGTVTFTMANKGSDNSEFEVLASDGLRIVSEKENIGPGTSGTLTTQLAAGDYYTACIPGLVGEGVRAKFTVTDSGKTVKATGTEKQQIDAADAAYVGYVKDQTGQLVTGTQEFLDAYLSGDDTKAKELYPTVRAHYERIEPVAESFGDLDPELDNRAADLEKGETWTGWHRIEKDLWAPSAAVPGSSTSYPALTAAEKKTMGAQLTKNTKQLYDEVNASDFTVGLDTIGNGAVGLLDEVATSKITGEEETWSHTDLYDFQANLEGAQVAYEGVRSILLTKDKALATELDAEFTSLDELLAKYGSLDKGYPSYTTLTTADKKALSDGVNALSEPLSQLTAALLG